MNGSVDGSVSTTRATLCGLFSARRLRLAGTALSAQLEVQALGLVTGILLVRVMDPAQFAWLTLAGSLLVTATVLADMGLASAVLAEGGRQAGQPQTAWAAVRADAGRVQSRLAMAALLLALPAGLFMFAQQHTGHAVAWALALMALGPAVLQARNGLTLSVVRLAGDVAWQQRADLALAAARLAAVVLALAWWLDINAVMALSLQALTALCMALVLKRWWVARQLAPTAAAVATGRHTPALHRQLLHQGPNALWFAVSSQFALWLVAVLGTGADVAALGALARLAGVFTVIGVLMATLAQPYFARQHDTAALGTAFVAINLIFSALLAAMLGMAAAWPQAVLWLLGPAYAGLANELLWMVAASTLAAWSGAVYSLGCARGWVLPLGWAVAATLAGTVLAVATLDLATPRGALAMNTLIASLSLLAVLVFMAHHLRRLPGPDVKAATRSAVLGSGSHTT